MNLARIGVWIDSVESERRWSAGENAFGRYGAEIYRQYGLPFRLIGNVDEIDAQIYDIVVVLGENGPTDEALASLWKFAEAGGTLVSYGGLETMRAKLGFEQGPAAPTATYALPPAHWGIDLGDASGQGARAVSVALWHGEGKQCETQGVMTERPSGKYVAPLMHIVAVGRGRVERWNVNVPDIVVRLQQGGKPVTEDGVPAPDGTANVNDDILKADDVMEMDWTLDRRRTETGMPYFFSAYADIWKEMMVAQLLHAGRRNGKALPILDLWPAGVERIVLISHDSDGNEDGHARSALALLAELGVQTTWCMLEPGYSPEIYGNVINDGHELAFHYNALAQDGGTWGGEAFAKQLAGIRSACGATITSNKNHYTRIEGWGELFCWCEANGITSDETRGPSKKGNVGFLFGTCQPFFPIAWADERNRLYDVVEVTFLSQDIEYPALSDRTIIAPLLEEAARRRGVAHFLFHQRHIHHLAEVREALRKVVREARERGFVFWTNRRLDEWVRFRRSLRLLTRGDRFEIASTAGYEGDAARVGVWIPDVAVPDEPPARNADGSVVRYGLRFAVHTVDMEDAVTNLHEDAMSGR